MIIFSITSIYQRIFPMEKVSIRSTCVGFREVGLKRAKKWHQTETFNAGGAITHLKINPRCAQREWRPFFPLILDALAKSTERWKLFNENYLNTERAGEINICTNYVRRLLLCFVSKWEREREASLCVVCMCEQRPAECVLFALAAAAVFLIFRPPHSTQRRLCFQKHSTLPWWLTKDPQALFPTNLVLRAAHSAELLKYAASLSRVSKISNALSPCRLSAFFSLAERQQGFPPGWQLCCCFNLANFEIVALVPPVKSRRPGRSRGASLLTFTVWS